jgi:NitT/TauT family transport system permease protein
VKAFLHSVLPPLVPLVLVTAGLEVAVARGWVEAFLVPRPSDAMRALWVERQQIAAAAGETVTASLSAFALSAAAGVATAILLATGGWVQRAFYPYAVFFQTVPIVAIAPLLAVWFGMDSDAVIASGVIVSFFPVLANALTGLRSVDPALADLFRLSRASPWATLIKLRLPSALPSIWTGLRVSSGLAVIGCIVGEFITGGGLGGLIMAARQQRALGLVFAALVVASLLGVALFATINLAARLTLRHWHASERD